MSPTLRQWKDFRPTPVDTHYRMDERENYYMAPVLLTRDSGLLDQANWEAMVAILNSEQCQEYEIHRFGHWLTGWFEVVLVPPDSKDHHVCINIAEKLQDYPILDEDKYSQMCQDEYLRSWNDYGCRDFQEELEKVLLDQGCDPEIIEQLMDQNPETMLNLYESLIPSGEYYTDTGNEFRLNTHLALDSVTEEKVLDALHINQNYEYE